MYFSKVKFYDQMTEWSEELPDQCPPAEAFSPDGQTLYRFTKSEVPSEADFISQRGLKPESTFNGISECIARSLSVFNDLPHCQKMLKLPRWKGARILACPLSEQDGLAMKTFKAHHYSWWKTNNFDIASAVPIETE